MGITGCRIFDDAIWRVEGFMECWCVTVIVRVCLIYKQRRYFQILTVISFQLPLFVGVNYNAIKTNTQILSLIKNIKKFCSRRWGSSLLGLRMQDPPLSPQSTWVDIFGKCVCWVTFKHLPEPLRSLIRSFRTLGQLLKIPPFVRPFIA